MLLAKAFTAFTAVSQLMETECDFQTAYELLQTKKKLQPHAEFFYQKEQELSNLIQYKLFAARQYFDSVMNREALKNSQFYLNGRRQELENLQSAIETDMNYRMKTLQDKLAAASAQIALQNPWNQLQKGWTITEHADGKRISSVENAKVGDSIVTIVADGKITSIVQEISPDSLEGAN